MSATVIYARRFVSLVKLEHTVFALPYAYAGAILALNGVPSASQVLWITVAMAGARSLAMALNRLIDASIDARNPRTARREIPAGLLSRASVAAFAFGSLIVFLVAVSQLAPLTRVLWPIPVLGFVIYPYLKRFTWLCHPFLGLVDGLAPVGGWVAVTNHVAGTSFILGGAVALWIGGFDIIYATMDLEIDRQQGLHSIPLRFGIKNALLITRVAHFCSVVLLVWLGRRLRAGAALLPRRGRRRRPARLRELDRQRGRPLAGRHGVPDHERRDCARVPGRGARRCHRLRPSPARGSCAGSASARPSPASTCTWPRASSRSSPGPTGRARRRSCGCLQP